MSDFGNYINSLSLPSSYKAFLSDRIARYTVYDIFEFMAGFSKDRAVILNNLNASKWASLAEPTRDLLSGGLGKTIITSLTSLIVSSGILLNASKEASKLLNDNKITLDYLQNLLSKTFSYSQSRGSSLIKTNFKNGKISHIVVPLGRFKINTNEFDEIVGVKIYERAIEDTSMNTKTYTYKSIICENREIDNNGNAFGYYTLEKWKTDNTKGTTEITDFSDKDELPNDMIEYAKANGFTFYKKIPLNFIGCYLINNTWYNSTLIDSPYGDSTFLGKDDLFYAYNFALTCKEVDKYLGKGKAIVPKQMQSGIAMRSTIDNVGGLMGNIMLGPKQSTQLESTFFTEIPSQADPTKPIQPTSIQFNLRTTEWREEIIGTVGDICASIGVTASIIDTRLVGSGQKTAMQISAEEDQTRLLIEDKRRLADKSIQAMLDDIASYYSIKEKISILWPEAGMSNKYLRSQTITNEYVQNARSLESSIKLLNPDWSQEQIDKEISLLRNVNVQQINDLFGKEEEQPNEEEIKQTE